MIAHYKIITSLRLEATLAETQRPRREMKNKYRYTGKSG